MSQPHHETMSLPEVARNALMSCGWTAEVLFSPSSALGFPNNNFNVQLNSRSDVEEFVGKSCVVIGASSPSSRALLQTVRKQTFQGSLYALETVRSDSGFYSLGENALSAPIGALSSPSILACLEEVHVLSASRAKIGDKVNCYVYLLKFSSAALASPQQNVVVQSGCLNMSPAVSSVIDLGNDLFTTCVLDCDRLSSVQKVAQQVDASIHHVRKHGDSFHVIASVAQDARSSSQFVFRMHGTSFRFAVLSHATDAAVTMYVPKSLRGQFDTYWATNLHRLSGYGICEAATFYTFCIEKMCSK